MFPLLSLLGLPDALTYSCTLFKYFCSASYAFLVKIIPVFYPHVNLVGHPYCRQYNFITTLNCFTFAWCMYCLYYLLLLKSWVDIRTWQYTMGANDVTAICAVAVRDMEETIILDMCDGGEFKYLVRFSPGTTSAHRMTLTTEAGNLFTVRQRDDYLNGHRRLCFWLHLYIERIEV